MLHALKLLEANGIGLFKFDHAKIKSPACHKSAVHFMENLKVVVGLAGVPGYSSLVTRQFWEAGTAATSEVLKEVSTEAIAGASADQLLAIDQAKERHMIDISKKELPKVGEFLTASTNILEHIVMGSKPYIHNVFESLLKTICIQAWTAIEVLLEDLHGSVIRDHSACFAVDVIAKHQRTRQNTKGQGDKFGFRSRRNYREGYDEAFSNDPAIHAAVWSTGIDALSSVRHLLVHKGGIVDKKFLNDDVKNNPGLNIFLPLAIDKPLLFDGLIVKTIVDAAISKGYELVGAVDRWVWSKHKASLPP